MISNLVNELNFKEKIGQTIIYKVPSFKNNQLDKLEEFLKKYPVGGLYVGGEIIKNSKNKLKAT